MKRFHLGMPKRIGYIICTILGMSLLNAEEPVKAPRTIIALYDGKLEPTVRNTLLQLYAEMPLNHLGYRLEYHNVENTLPDLQARTDVLGVLSWFPANAVVPNPHQYIKWAIQVINLGKKFVILENPGFYAENDTALSMRQINKLWAKLGMRDRGKWNIHTYSTQFSHYDRRMVGFERNYEGILPSYRHFELISPGPTAHAIARQAQTDTQESALVITGPQGSHISHEYALYYIYNSEGDRKQWFINPFRFFRLAFDSSALPKPDTTTLAGRRLYYSHIDGDGWNNVTMLENYRENPTLCAEVIFHDVLKPNLDLPCTVAPIAADINLQWVGTEEGRKITHRLFALPNVEVGCHTFTHPFDWGFFENYHPEEEKPYFSLYPQGGWEHPTVGSAIAEGWRKISDRFRNQPFRYPIKNLQEGYLVPRAFALKPFNLDLEVDGAIRDVNELATAVGKKTTVYQWSGNCQPFEAALKHVREAGVMNLNGGTTRFDDEFPSYSWVSPLGFKLGPEQQIYASNSNENTYTHMWMGKYYGFNQLPKTFKNTETPIRLRPMNLYYHMYSGERQAGLSALLGNIAYIRSQEMTPITASHFAGIVNDFYHVEFVAAGQDRWQVINRGTLQTIRFDEATLRGVDFTRSVGVIGQRHFQGSLYAYLDANVKEPVVALQTESQFWHEPKAKVPYVIDSRWPLWNVQMTEGSVSFTTQGFGEGEMRWRIPSDTELSVEVEGGVVATATPLQGIAKFVLPRSWKSQQVVLKLDKGR